MQKNRLDTIATLVIGLAAVAMVGLAIADRVRIPRRASVAGSVADVLRRERGDGGQIRVGADVIVRWASMGNLIGPRDAPVRIVEFADFECSFCATLHGSFVEMRTKYPDLISVRWIHAVERSGSSPSRAYALASECAAQQGKFAAFHDHVFSQESHLGTDKEFYKTAELIGVPSFDRFAACLEASEGAAKVDAEAEETIEMGISGTPTWFVNGRPFVGVISPDSLESVIVRELQRVRGR